MATFGNIAVLFDDWIDVRQVTGFLADFQIQNITPVAQGQYGRVLIFEGDVKPEPFDYSGSILYPPSYGFNSVAHITGFDPIWIRAAYEKENPVISVTG